MMRRTIISFAFLLFPLLEAEEFTAEQIDFFEKRIRPVLSEKCHSCHSASSEKLRAALLVDHREHLLQGGDTGAAIVPGNPADSLLIKSIAYELDDIKMPPKGMLSPQTVEDFKKWIAEGAAWPNESVPQRGGSQKLEHFDLQQRFETHWSWREVKKPALPVVKTDDPPLRSEIDAFIRARLEPANLRPAEEADRRTFIRRVFFDLIGMPPSPEQIADFLSDSSPGSYEKLIDSLLSSPHFGEKWARHWMDLVRYAETYGHEFDYPLNYAFEYRDYLIRAYNADLPYDQFLHEHLAGDLVANPRRNPEDDTNESIRGTAFWYFHEATHAPTDVRQDEADRMDNQLDVFGKSFLGLTVSCARCHDHKFDAISTADYYALTTYLQSSCRQEYPLDPGRMREKSTIQLDAWRNEGEAEFSKISLAKIHKVRPGNEWMAATELIRETIKARKEVVGDPWSGVVFEDFESGSYGKWTVEGAAFGEMPAVGAFGPQQLKGHRGKGLANSFNGDDKLQGVLTSEEFVVEKPYLNFLIAGGLGPELAFEVWIDGAARRVARGKNTDHLEPASWDLSEYLGKKAQLKIIDRAKGGWGHIDVDHIVFSDVSAVEPDSLPFPSEQDIARFAATRGLREDRLRAWLHVVSGGKKNGGAPGELLEKLLGDTKAVTEGARNAQERDRVKRAEFEKKSTRLVSFSDPSSNRSGWSTSGSGFRKPWDRITLGFEADYPFALPGVYSSGCDSEKQNGALRSPTFEIKARQIHFRARAKDLFARVVMDNYHMAQFNGLLFNGTTEKSLNSDEEYRWFSFRGNLEKYIGHHAYLEFVDKAGARVDLAELWTSDEGPPPVETHPVVKAALGSSGATLEDIAANLNAAWDRSWEGVKSGSGGPEDAELLNWMARRGLFSLQELAPEVTKLIAQGRDLVDKLPGERYALAMAEGTSEESYVHIRGSYRSPGEKVVMRNLTALGGREGNRLAIAHQLTDPSNPLVARVMVNRLWHHLFGRGLVPTVDDFGPMGQEPSHPELLDWLATTFVEDGWSVKKMIRQMVLSHTYRQSSHPHPSLEADRLAEWDPNNVLLHRMPVRRLQAEAIRDAMLTISGRLDDRLFGPSVPTHLTEFMTGRGSRASGPLDGAGRRSIYGAVYRNFLSPLMLIFDQPSPFGPKGGRSVSNVPAQSLALMNDPFVMEQARLWATRSATESTGQPIEMRIRLMHEQAFGELPSEGRLINLREFLESQGSVYGQPADERTWVDLGHVLFNMKDFIYLK